MKTYKPKALIDGSAIDQEAGTSWVAVPDKFAGRHVMVEYAGTNMVIKDWRGQAVMFKRFRDKFWRAGSNRPQYYTLGYFRYTPYICDAYEPADSCQNPNCGGDFAHNLVGMAGGDLPAGYTESV